MHHCTKSSDVASAPLEKVIGSIGITDTAETILVKEQQTGSKDSVLHLTGQDVEQCEKYLNWNSHGFNISDDLRESKLGATQKLVLELTHETLRCTQNILWIQLVRTRGKWLEQSTGSLKSVWSQRKTLRFYLCSYHTWHIYHLYH